MAKSRWQAQTRLNGRNTEVIDGVQDIVGPKRGKKIMSAFIDVMIHRWQREIRKMNIGREGDLSDSFTKSTGAGGDVITGRSRFNYYGRMVDWGVGKGVTIEEQRSGIAATRDRARKSNRRKPKPWYMSVWLYERHRLAEVFQAEIADELLKRTKSEFENPQ